MKQSDKYKDYQAPESIQQYSKQFMFNWKGILMLDVNKVNAVTKNVDKSVSQVGAMIALPLK